MSLLNDKVAVVTGAGRGIGRAVAIAYARMGADVICVSRTEENSAKVAAEVEELGRKAWAKAVDVSDTAAVEAAAKEILEQAGKVDILVNNAGVTRDNLLMRMSEEEWDTVLNTNLKGAFNFTKAFTRPFMKQRSGRIINIASVIGLIGNAGQSNYAASKAALHRLHQIRGQGAGATGRHRQRHRPRLHRNRHDRCARRKSARGHPRARANDPIRFTGRHRPYGGVFGHGTDQIHDWTGAHRRWWHGHVSELFGIRGLTALPPVLKEPANVTAAYV